MSLFATNGVAADDLSVFTSGIGTHKPNILFVLDFSGSMKHDVNGNDTSSSGLSSRANVLKDAVNDLLNQNEHRINAGFSVFNWTASGIKWPVTDLSASASSIDPTIPSGSTLTGKDVLINNLNSFYPGNETATVAGLTEAALYFSGGEVVMGGIDSETSADDYEPQVWSTANNRHEGGYYLAANPITYEPQNAFQYNVPGSSLRYCKDYSVGGSVSGASNQCSGKTTISCEYKSARSGTYTGSVEGESGVWEVKQHNYCSYAYPHSWAGANYVSPIVDSCQQNFIILISDGEPTVRRGSSAMESILGHPASACEDLSNSIFSGSSTTSDEGNCGPEIVNKLSSTNQVPGIDGSWVTTYTVGFNVAGPGEKYLERLAGESGGLYFSADKPEDLTNALNDALLDILATTESFSALSIDVDKAHFSDDNRVFFPLFTPSLQSSWSGNLKGYFIDEKGLKDINNLPATIKKDGVTRFTDTAQSFWSSGIDGNETELGGASGLLEGTVRNLYTYTGSAIPDLGAALNVQGGTHDITTANTALTSAMMGIPDNATLRGEIIDWLRDAPMGDPLHTRSVTVKYPGQSVVYLMTNQGFIHAIDASTPTDPSGSDTTGGNEIFAFMPPELLTNLALLKAKNRGGGHIYGLDGGITRWHDDDNNDGIVNGSDTLMLIFGMRRGGNHYYALDVTDPDRPILKWRIDGGQGDFTDLAQTWSRMSLVTVNKNGKNTRVLVFGGGYDDATMDGASNRTAAKGASVYMVDRNGNKIWSASHSDMLYSIPSDPAVIDSDSDGAADRIYVGDLGGQVWRIDFADVDVSSGFKVNRLADLGNSAFRPFFYAPSIALSGSSSNSYLSVVLGSGNRTNPLQLASSNIIAMLKDTDVDAGPPAAGFSTIQASNLYNATANAVASSNATTADAAVAALNGARGWFINLAVGEKSLSAPVTFEGNVLATTFSPVSTTVSTNVCLGSSTEGRYYVMSLRDAQPVRKIGADKSTASTSALSAGDRSRVVSLAGIPSSPMVVFPKGTEGVLIVVDREVVESVGQQVERMHWYTQK